MTWKIEGNSFKDKVNPPEPGSIWDGIIDYDRKVSFANKDSLIYYAIRFYGYDSDQHLEINMVLKNKDPKIATLSCTLAKFGKVTVDDGCVGLITTHDNLAAVLDQLSQTDKSLDVNAKKAIVGEVTFPAPARKQRLYY